MTELSPGAQAVRSAYHKICEDYIETWLNFNHNRGLAAALRAVAEQVVPPEQKTPWNSFIQAPAAELRIRNELLAIADELEGLN